MRRHQPAAVGHGRHHADHLQRRGRQRALADGHRLRVGGSPGVTFQIADVLGAREACRRPRRASPRPSAGRNRIARPNPPAAAGPSARRNGRSRRCSFRPARRPASPRRGRCLGGRRSRIAAGRAGASSPGKRTDVCGPTVADSSSATAVSVLNVEPGGIAMRLTRSNSGDDRSAIKAASCRCCRGRTGSDRTPAPRRRRESPRCARPSPRWPRRRERGQNYFPATNSSDPFFGRRSAFQALRSSSSAVRCKATSSVSSTSWPATGSSRR